MAAEQEKMKIKTITDPETGASSATVTKSTKSSTLVYSEGKKKSSSPRPLGKLFCAGFLALLLVGGLVGTLVYYNLQPARRDYQWWHKTTIYQIYPRSFQDSDGDGTGDLKGNQITIAPSGFKSIFSQIANFFWLFFKINFSTVSFQTIEFTFFTFWIIHFTLLFSIIPLTVFVEINALGA